MSSGGNAPQDVPSRQSGTDNSGSQPSNIIEFVDSQDPNVRSAIQRHTAYHSAAQRREARSRLLRRSSQTRYLGWTRRTGGDADVATSSASSASSVSKSPAPSLPERKEPSSHTSSNERVGVTTEQAAAEPATETLSATSQAMISADASVLEFCKSPQTSLSHPKSLAVWTFGFRPLTSYP